MRFEDIVVVWTDTTDTHDACIAWNAPMGMYEVVVARHGNGALEGKAHTRADADRMVKRMLAAMGLKGD